jgi:hypothetical protein
MYVNQQLLGLRRPVHDVAIGAAHASVNAQIEVRESLPLQEADASLL